MIAPFVEAIRAIPQPCTFLLVVPAVVGVVAARARWWVLGAALVAAIVGGWLVAANRFILDGWVLRLSGLLVVMMLIASVADPVRRRLNWIDHPASGAVLAGGTTLLASMWWRPCVGVQLGQILTAGQHGGRDLVGQFPAMAAYMVGLMVPVIVMVLAVRSIEPSEIALDWTARVAAVVGAIVAGTLFFGRHEDVVVTLTRWTLE